MIRIAVVDDHPVVRAGLRAYLGDSPGLCVVAEASHGGEVVNLVRRVAVDVVILDLSMPGHGGLEALRAIKSRVPQVPVLVLSGFPAAMYSNTVKRLGASAYLNKACDPEDIVTAVKHLCASGIAPFRVPALPAAAVISTSPPHDQLNAREFQIFLRLAKGEAVASIAKNLSLSAATISVYTSHLRRKLLVRNQAEMTHYALTHGLL
jgi:two-component system, NarL family, invasion response regulator UvrY